ncbi:MAG: hypothetical protein IJL07_09435 [Lachnospiraceae bacterium]|nr:hypothetical protein [Lachnospiraceae bacterium]
MDSLKIGSDKSNSLFEIELDSYEQDEFLESLSKNTTRKKRERAKILTKDDFGGALDKEEYVDALTDDERKKIENATDKKNQEQVKEDIKKGKIKDWNDRVRGVKKGTGSGTQDTEQATEPNDEVRLQEARNKQFINRLNKWQQALNLIKVRNGGKNSGSFDTAVENIKSLMFASTKPFSLHRVGPTKTPAYIKRLEIVKETIQNLDKALAELLEESEKEVETKVIRNMAETSGKMLRYIDNEAGVAFEKGLVTTWATILEYSQGEYSDVEVTVDQKEQLRQEEEEKKEKAKAEKEEEWKEKRRKQLRKQIQKEKQEEEQRKIKEEKQEELGDIELKDLSETTEKEKEKEREETEEERIERTIRGEIAERKAVESLREQVKKAEAEKKEKEKKEAAEKKEKAKNAAKEKKEKDNKDKALKKEQKRIEKRLEQIRGEVRKEKKEEETEGVELDDFSERIEGETDEEREIRKEDKEVILRFVAEEKLRIAREKGKEDAKQKAKEEKENNKKEAQSKREEEKKKREADSFDINKLVAVGRDFASLRGNPSFVVSNDFLKQLAVIQSMNGIVGEKESDFSNLVFEYEKDEGSVTVGTGSETIQTDSSAKEDKRLVLTGVRMKSKGRTWKAAPGSGHKYETDEKSVMWFLSFLGLTGKTLDLEKIVTIKSLRIGELEQRLKDAHVAEDVAKRVTAQFVIAKYRLQGEDGFSEDKSDIQRYLYYVSQYNSQAVEMVDGFYQPKMTTNKGFTPKEGETYDLTLGEAGGEGFESLAGDLTKAFLKLFIGKTRLTFKGIYAVKTQA